jgi:hypothetical protein
VHEPWAEIVSYYSALASDPEIRAGRVVLADCRRVTSGPSFLDLHALANAKAQLAPGLRPTRAAVLVHKLVVWYRPRRWLVTGSDDDKRVASSRVSAVHFDRVDGDRRTDIA